ncbi:hypothetical protein BH23CHL2_BH23CHL2_16280 [soil metagenome]
MGKITITITPQLDAEIEEYLEFNRDNGDLSTLVGDALRDYLARRRDELEIINPDRPRRTLRITSAREGSGRSDVSINHDNYLVEELMEDRTKK